MTVGSGVTVGSAVGTGVAVLVGVGLGVTVGVNVAVGEKVGVRVGVGVAVGGTNSMRARSPSAATPAGSIARMPPMPITSASSTTAAHTHHGGAERGSDVPPRANRGSTGAV